jgi:hypothetical protein
MPTNALAAYGIQLKLGDGIQQGPVNVLAAANTTPIILTTQSHGIVDVSWVTVTGVTGNTAANGTWIAVALDSVSMYLEGSSGNGAYAGAGLMTLSDTFATIAEVTNIQDAGIVSTLVDASAHDGNGWVSRVPTLMSSSAGRVSINFVPTHPTHNATTGLGHVLLTKARRNWLLVFPSPVREVWHFSGFVTGHRVGAPVAGLLTSEITIEMTDAPTLGIGVPPF